MTKKYQVTREHSEDSGPVVQETWLSWNEALGLAKIKYEEEARLREGLPAIKPEPTQEVLDKAQELRDIYNDPEDLAPITAPFNEWADRMRVMAMAQLFQRKHDHTLEGAQVRHNLNVIIAAVEELIGWRIP